MAGIDKVLLITGVSSGIGRACYEHFSKPGYAVVGTIRKGAEGPDGTPARSTVRMDVLDDASIRRAVEQTLGTHKKIDVLINNAGISLVGSLEDTSMEEAKLQFDVNFWGTVKLIKAVLPVMREQGFGHIVNIGSLAGVVALPFQAFYSGGKYAVEGISEALSMEVKPFGIKVTIIEPGDFNTPLTQNRVVAKQARGDSRYADRFEKTLAVIERGESRGEPPARIPDLIERVIHARSPKLRYRIGKSRELFAASLSALLPRRAFEKLLMDYFDL